VLELPDDLRGAFKDPLGPVFTDPESLLAAADAGIPLVAVGDVVTAHLLDADYRPHVAIIDGRTERERVDESISQRLPAPDVTVSNPPAMLSHALLDALVTALARDDPTVIEVEGEEDLAALPAILAAPVGGSVVYGQPGEGMVLVPVTDETQSLARDLLTRMAGDVGAALDLLDAR
jgi:uncharacterized protein (UPF0218 family)